MPLLLLRVQNVHADARAGLGQPGGQLTPFRSNEHQHDSRSRHTFTMAFTPS